MLLALPGYSQKPTVIEHHTFPVGTTAPACKGVAYGNSVYIAVTEAGLVYTSSDGDLWSFKRALNHSVNSLAFGQGTFVAVGPEGFISTSVDGSTWTTRASGTPNALNDVKFLQGKFYAVGKSGTALTSPDASVWTPITVVSAAARYELIDIEYGNGKYIIGARWLTSGAHIICSATGLSNSWTSRPLPMPGIGDRLDKLQFLKDRFFLFLKSGQVLTAFDDSAWSILAGTKIDLPDSTSTTFSTNNAIYHGLYDGTSIFLFGKSSHYSTEGAVYSNSDTSAATPPPGHFSVYPFSDISAFTLQPQGPYMISEDAAYINGKYFRWGRGLVTSDNGSVYKYQGASFKAVASNGSGYVVTGTGARDGEIFRSQDFTSLDNVTPEPVGSLSSVVFNGSKYVAAGDRAIWESPDGNSWTKTISTTDVFYGIAFGASKFVGVAFDSHATGPKIAWSSSGSRWTTVNTDNNQYLRVKYVNGRFFALGYRVSSEEGVIYTSVDGTEWANVSPSGLETPVFSYNDVAWDGSKYHFIGMQYVGEKDGHHVSFFTLSSADPTSPASFGGKAVVTDAPEGVMLGSVLGDGVFEYANGQFVGVVTDRKTGIAYVIYSQDGSSWKSIPTSVKSRFFGSLVDDGKVRFVGSESQRLTVVPPKINRSPIAMNVGFSGNMTVGQELTGNYTFSDPDNDAEGTSVYRWYRSEDSTGTGKSVIPGATSGFYTLGETDKDKFISFEVTPNDGSVFGAPVEGPSRGPVAGLPAISSAAYDSSTGVLDVTGVDLQSLAGALNDIIVSKLTVTGEGGNAHTLTSGDVEITGNNSFSIALNVPDKNALHALLNNNGISSAGGAVYNLAAAEDWAAGTYAGSNIADLIGNSIVVSNRDVTAPAVTEITLSADTLRTGMTAVVTFSFSEPVTGFTLADLAAENGMLTDLSSSDGGVTWTATLSPSAGVESAVNVITVTMSGVSDTSGNAGEGTVVSPNYSVYTLIHQDVIPPTVNGVTLSADTLRTGMTAVVTFSFSEPVTGFTLADLAAENGTLTDLSSSDGGVTWTATLSPVSGIRDAENKITLPVSGVSDTSGNAGQGTVVSPNYSVYTVVPAVVVSRSVVPAISAVGSLASFSATYGAASASQTITVSGTNLVTGIVVTAPNGFEVSTDSLTFGNTVNIGSGGNTPATPVFVRLKGTIPAGNYSGSINLTSENATSVTVTSNPVNVVSRAILAISATAVTRVYDGDNAATVNFSDNRRPGDVFSLSYTSASFSDKNAGMAKQVTVGGISIDGPAAANYTYNDSCTTTADIVPRALTVIATGTDKVYDGTIAAVVKLSDNRLPGDVLSLDYTGALFDNKNAATGKTVTVSGIRISGADAANYSFNITANATADIAPKDLTITANDASMLAGTNIPVLSVRYNGFVNGEYQNCLNSQPLVTTTATSASPLGNYPIRVSGAAAGNYTITFAEGTLKVVPGAPTAIALAGATLPENRPAGTVAGILSSVSDDPAATFTYTMAAGIGDTDNGLFNIKGDTLLSALSLNFEQKSRYTIRVRSLTQNGLSSEQVLTVLLTDVNEAPTLSAIDDVTVCSAMAPMSIQMSGASAGPEKEQHISYAVATDNEELFALLSINNSGRFSYQIKPGLTGTAVVTVTVKDDGGIDNGGADAFSRNFSVTVNPLPAVTINSDKGISISKGETVRLTAAGGQAYRWVNPEGVVSGEESATLIVRPDRTATYRVLVTSDRGCISEKEISIEVKEDYLTLDRTNILTPNGDGVNDAFVIRNIDMYQNHVVKIFDRAGRVLYTKANYRNEWDGTLRGTPLPGGTYYYAVDFGNNKPVLKGFITIIRD